VAVDPFTSFLVSWAAGKVLDKSFGTFVADIDTYVGSLIKSPLSEGWDEDLTADQISLVQTLRQTTPSRLGRFIAKFRNSRPRPIVLLGPSGVGKTCVALRLAGKTPERVMATKDAPETEKFVAGLKAINVISPPGYRLHGDYLDTVSRLMRSNQPPSVICVIVCGGFHATALPGFEGTLEKPNFSRPDQRGAIPATIEGFRKVCFREEELYLGDVFDTVAGHLRESIPWVVTVVNKRDLWWHYPDVMKRYESQRSGYGKALTKLRGPECFGAPDGSTSSHILFPAYLSDDGFGPDPSFQSTALRQAHMEADAMVLRAIVFNKYARGLG
jgi:hypothetical protein